MLRKDICVHFSALPSFFKKYVEFQYNNEVYHNVFCTSTLLEGINTPTEELIVFDSDDMKSPFKLNNLIGRVGRLDTYKKGNVYFFDNDLISLVEDDEKYLSIEIVAETDVANSVEDALFMDKKTSDLTEEDNELLFQTKNIIFEHKINMNVFKTIPMINLQDFINFKFLIPELLNLTRNYLEENDPKQKIKINQEVYSKIIGLFEIKYLFKFNKINGEINDYNKKNDEKIPFIKIDVVIIKLLDMKRNIFKKIKEMVSVYVGKLPDTTLSTYVELLFYLSFNYIKYELAQVVIFYELLFNDDYLLTKPEEDQKIIAEFNEIFLKRIRKRNYDDDPISKALDELGVPATDINYVKKIIENDCKDNFSFSSMVYSIKKNVEKIKANKDIDDLTKEMVEIWI